MIETPGQRVIAVLCCLLALGGLLVAHGAVGYDPDRNTYPGNEEVGTSYTEYVGDRVVLAGTVVETDPVVLEGSAGVDDEFQVTLLGFKEDVSTGDDVWLAGTVEPEDAVAVESAIVREPWEIQYMYVVSLIGGLWVLGRFLRGWRFDLKQVAFVPRSESTEGE